jgi:hypothetical protein
MANQSGNQGGNQGDGRGLAGMDPERQREIASQGGQAAHAKGDAHEFTSEEARRAGSQSYGGQDAQGAQRTEGDQSSGGSGSTRGSTPQQHAEAGRQSHKNDAR